MSDCGRIFALRTSLESVLVYLTYVQDWVWPARFPRMHIGTEAMWMAATCALTGAWCVPERAARMARLGSAACATWCERKAPFGGLYDGRSQGCGACGW